MTIYCQYTGPTDPFLRQDRSPKETLKGYFGRLSSSSFKVTLDSRRWLSSRSPSSAGARCDRLCWSFAGDIAGVLVDPSRQRLTSDIGRMIDPDQYADAGVGAHMGLLPRQQQLEDRVAHWPGLV